MYTAAVIKTALHLFLPFGIQTLKHIARIKKPNRKTKTALILDTSTAIKREWEWK
jgi:hypothetical protein